MSNDHTIPGTVAYADAAACRAESRAQAWEKECVRLRALNEELVETLGRLTRWSKCFVEDTPISAETLWRGFPQAIKDADALLDRAKGGSDAR